MNFEHDFEGDFREAFDNSDIGLLEDLVEHNLAMFPKVLTATTGLSLKHLNRRMFEDATPARSKKDPR